MNSFNFFFKYYILIKNPMLSSAYLDYPRTSLCPTSGINDVNTKTRKYPQTFQNPIITKCQIKF